MRSRFQHFLTLRPTPGTMFRIAVDIVAIWLSTLFGWLLVAGHGISALFEDVATPTLLLIVLWSLVAVVTYAGAGLYARPYSHLLSMKLRRIVTINLVLFSIAIYRALDAPQQTATELQQIFAAFASATLLHCLSRLAAAVLRFERAPEAAKSSSVGENEENKVLVIGGAGYIGSALVEKLLGQGLQVSVLDAMHYGDETLARVIQHPNLTLIRDDFRHIEVLTRAMNGIGSVIHLGGLVGDPACAVEAELTIDVNVTATKLVSEIAKACGVRRFIFASSCSVYGACDEIVDEVSRLNPQSLYARTKVASEIVLGALNSPQFAVTCLRFATIYGLSGRVRFDLVVNLFCAKAVRDRIISVFGADQWRPFVHVDDVATAVMMTLRAPVALVAGEAFNVGCNAQNFTLGDVAELVNRQVPDARIAVDDTFVDRRNYRVCFDKIRVVLGFEPAWTLERGIAQVVTRVRSNEVGHYTLPAYSNVLYLKERGTQAFANFKITGWETELMNVDRIATGKMIDRPAAA